MQIYYNIILEILYSKLYYYQKFKYAKQAAINKKNKPIILTTNG